jgi:hypothetical protein
MAPRKAFTSLTFATAVLSVCFIVAGGSPLRAQGYQPGAAFQPGAGGPFQTGTAFQPGGGALQPGAAFQPGIGGANQPGTGPNQPSISGTTPLSGQFQPSTGGPSQPKGR